MTITVPWEDHLRSLGIPPRLIAYTAAPIPGNGEFESVRTAAGARMPWPLVVYLFGDNGNGKTHSATWLFSVWHARQFVKWDSDKGKYQPRAKWTTERAVTEALKAYGDDNFDMRRAMLLYTEPDILLIDDVFTEKTSDTDITNITDLLETRRDSDRITIITSNKGPLTISNDYSVRLAERLIDNALVLEFTGPSHRMTQYFKQSMEQ